MKITALYAGIASLIFLILSCRVVAARLHGPSLGDGGDTTLLRKIRAHGNFSEYVPLILIMMGILEINNFQGIYLHTIGLGLVISRAFHGYALSFTSSYKFGRMFGTALTFLLLFSCGTACIFSFLKSI